MLPDHRDALSRRALTAAAVLIGALAVAPAPARAAERMQLATTRTVPMAATSRGEVVEQRAFSLHGIPVRRAFETAKVAPGGTRRIVARSAPTADAQVEPHEAVIDPDDLPGLVAAGLGLSKDPAFERAPELVYLTVLGAPVLVWECPLRLRMRPEPSRKTVWVSAMTGRVVDDVEHVRSARTRVFAENPSKTPIPIEVPLNTLPDVAPGDPLTSETIRALNCLDAEPEEVPEYLEDGDCFPTQTVLADENGDFFVPLPDIIDESDSTRPQDRYSELSLYYHTERFFEELADRGIYEFSCEQATLLANSRSIDPAEPLDNAFYTNQCDAELGPTMIFGQGGDVDFGYDADVVYHELGHGLVAMLTPEGLNGRYQRHDSSGVDAGAMNEGFADYFAFMITEDPRLAEYVGRFWTSAGSEIRHGENTNRCPDNTVSQVHNDGEAFQAALWATRSKLDDTRIPSEKVVLDKIVLASLTHLGPESNFSHGAAALLAEAADARDAGELTEFGYDLLARSLRARGLTNCARIISDREQVEAGRSMYLRRKNAAVHPFWPGPMQLRYEVPEGVDAVEIAYGTRGREEDRIGAAVLIKWGPEPITFEYELSALEDPGRIREVTLVSGDWDLELEPPELEDGQYRAKVENVAPGEVFHVTLASLSGGDVTASSVRVVPNVFTPPGEEDEADDDDDAAADDDDGPVHAGAAVAGGCGCRQPPEAPLPWLLILPLLALRRRG